MGYFEDKLRIMITRLSKDARKEFERAKDRIASELQLHVECDVWEPDADLDESIISLHSATDTISATEYLERKFFELGGRIEDLQINSQDLDKVQDSINDHFFDEPTRGFVYVAWRMRPEGYFYVGKAGDHSRLRLKQHGSIANSIRDSKYISLLFPPRGRESILFECEAALIHVVDAFSARQGIRGLTLNHQRPRLPVTQQVNSVHAGLERLLTKSARRLGLPR